MFCLLKIIVGEKLFGTSTLYRMVNIWQFVITNYVQCFLLYYLGPEPKGTEPIILKIYFLIYSSLSEKYKAKGSI